MALISLKLNNTPADVAYARLLELLRDPEWKWRSRAALALPAIQPRPPDAVRHLMKSLQDYKGEVRLAAVCALGRFGKDALEAEYQLQIVSLQDCDLYIREKARESFVLVTKHMTGE